MCDFSAILGYIAAAQLAVIAAIALTVTAIAVNSSFFAAPTAVLPFGLALASTAGAVTFLYSVEHLMGASGCSAGACSSAYRDALNAILAAEYAFSAATVLGIIAMATAAVPYVGAVAMAAYSVALVVGAAMLGPMTDKVAALQRCVEAVNSTPAATVLTVTGYIVGAVAVGFVLIIMGMGRNGGGTEDDPFKPDNNDKPKG